LPGDPQLIVVAAESDCVVMESLRSIAGGNEGVYVRVLRVRRINGDQVEWWGEVWARRRDAMKLARELRRRGGACRILQMGSGTFVIKMCYKPGQCPMSSRCVMLDPPGDAIVDSTIVTPSKMVISLIAFSRRVPKKLERMGYRVLASTQLPLPSLTSNQFKILLQAYLSGYYSFPRRISLKDLAKRLNMSISGLAEALRKAEHKIILNYITKEGLLYMHAETPDN
jgi:AraC-like DNA-binding protein